MEIASAYRLKLYPTRDQASLMHRSAGCVRWLWNHLLDMNGKQYETDGTFVFRMAMQKLIPGLKTEHPWLTEAPSSSLQRVCATLDRALKDSFSKKKGLPKFKGKFTSRTSFYVSNDTLRMEGNRIVLPKLGSVRFRHGRPVHGKLMGATLSFDGRNWWCALQVIEDREISPAEVSPDSTIGIDLGLTNYVVTSDGEVFDADHPLRKMLKRLRRAERIKARRRKGSARRRKAVAAVRRLHVRIAAKRHTLQHSVSKRLVDASSVIVTEDLNISGMARAKRQSLAVSDAGWGELVRQIGYKSLWAGKTHINVDRFFPSTQICSSCGERPAENIGRHVRTYRCGHCGLVMDRDLNAALNIRRRGLELLGSGTGSHTCSPTVGQVLPEPVRRSTNHTYARGEPNTGPGVQTSGRCGSLKRESSMRDAGVS